MKFIADINSTSNTIEDLKNVTINQRIESESPAALLRALAFVNGTGNGVPTLEKLLVHLFEGGAAYAGRNYTIFVNFKD